MFEKKLIFLCELLKLMYNYLIITKQAFQRSKKSLISFKKVAPRAMFWTLAVISIMRASQRYDQENE